VGTRIDRTIAKIEGMVDAINKCGCDDCVQFDNEESKILLCILEETLKALHEKQESA